MWLLLYFLPEINLLEVRYSLSFLDPIHLPSMFFWSFHFFIFLKDFVGCYSCTFFSCKILYVFYYFYIFLFLPFFIRIHDFFKCFFWPNLVVFFYYFFSSFFTRPLRFFYGDWNFYFSLISFNFFNSNYFTRYLIPFLSDVCFS